MDQDRKVRENKARRAAERRGWKLQKSRARDPHALGYGMYLLLDLKGAPVGGVGTATFLSELPYSYSIEDIERLLDIT